VKASQVLQRQRPEENNVFRTQLARNSAKYLWLSRLVTALLAIVWVFLRQNVQLLMGAAAIASVTIAVGLYPALHRRGRPQLTLYVRYRVSE
jgi:hypothetical protein